MYSYLANNFTLDEKILQIFKELSITTNLFHNIQLNFLNLKSEKGNILLKTLI